VLGREPTQAELNKVMERRLHYLYQTVADSDDYRVLEGVEELLPQMLEQVGFLHISLQQPLDLGFSSAVKLVMP
jgi:hypothetical protein